MAYSFNKIDRLHVSEAIFVHDLAVDKILADEDNILPNEKSLKLS